MSNDNTSTHTITRQNTITCYKSLCEIVQSINDMDEVDQDRVIDGIIIPMLRIIYPVTSDSKLE